MASINDILEKMVEQDASDLHLNVGAPPRVRINGKLIDFTNEKLLPTDIKNLLKDYINQKYSMQGGQEPETFVAFLNKILIKEKENANTR